MKKSSLNKLKDIVTEYEEKKEGWERVYFPKYTDEQVQMDKMLRFRCPLSIYSCSFNLVLMEFERFFYEHRHKNIFKAVQSFSDYISSIEDGLFPEVVMVKLGRNYYVRFEFSHFKSNRMNYYPTAYYKYIGLFPKGPKEMEQMVHFIDWKS